MSSMKSSMEKAKTANYEKFNEKSEDSTVCASSRQQSADSAGPELPHSADSTD
jgi:hypothetical protein